MAIQIDLPMPKDCEHGSMGPIKLPGIEEYKTVWFPCPCYDMELMECQGVVPNRTLYDPKNGIDELQNNHRPEWCPLKE